MTKLGVGGIRRRAGGHSVKGLGPLLLQFVSKEGRVNILIKCHVPNSHGMGVKVV